MSGLCRVRYNRKGQGETPFYGFVTSLGLDPIEKKPLYHFRPGSSILSAGFAGCNLACPFCQNHHISQRTDAPGQYIPPKELIKACQKDCSQIAYTYSEPLIHIEYLLDCMTEARKQGIANVLVSSGCVNSKASEEVLALTDAANIDLKCFSPETYSKILGGDLEAVLNFIRTACNMGVHVELTTLVVPGLNDSEQELEACVDFIAGLRNARDLIPDKPLVPWHLSAYHPDWKWKAPPTPPEFLAQYAAKAAQRLAFVYTGNIPGETNNSVCPYCGKILVSRRAYKVNTPGLLLEKKNGKSIYTCASCGKEAPIRA
jgi:pyruvate formate lyase activating enzyme